MTERYEDGLPIDVAAALGATDREVAEITEDGATLIAVTASRTYGATADEVWSALVEPDRLRRWFLPVSGDLREGGEFATEGNASGRILRCDPPRLLRVTWGADNSVVRVALTEDAGSTTLQLRHTIPIELAQNGAGALFVGPGWDPALVGLAAHLAGRSPEDPVVAEASPRGQELTRSSMDLWADAVRRSGTATDEELAGMIEMVASHWAPDL